MQDEFKIKRILEQLESIRKEVSAMQSVPNPEPEPVHDPVPREIEVPAPAPESREPDAMEGVWAKMKDWIFVRGEFAPKGMTREFAIATRWLTSIGSILLVGAIVYFLMLAIDKGWIEPASRVYGMMAWGVAGTACGAWLKPRSERYAILCDMCTAIGLVSLYLSLGLGHRFFDPPVIESAHAAFVGLLATTIAAGTLSVRLRSRTIAYLALAGGFLVPIICSFSNHYIQLYSYLFALSLGAISVAIMRGWTAYGFAAIMVALGMSCTGQGAAEAVVQYVFIFVQFIQFMALCAVASERRANANRSPIWAAAALMSLVSFGYSSAVLGNHFGSNECQACHFLTWTVVFSSFAFASHSRNWGGTPVMIFFAFVSAVLAICTICIKCWKLDVATDVLVFSVFAAILVELGTRNREKSLQILSLVFAAALSLIGPYLYAINIHQYGHGYASGLVARIQCLWSVSALIWFAACRLVAPGMYLHEIRRHALAAAFGMVFLVLTFECHYFGQEFLPSLRGGFMTIAWAIVASLLLFIGIVCRKRWSRLAGLGILAASVAKLLLADTSSLATPVRIGVFAAVGVMLIVGAFLYLKFNSRFEEMDQGTSRPACRNQGDCSEVP